MYFWTGTSGSAHAVNAGVLGAYSMEVLTSNSFCVGTGGDACCWVTGATASMGSKVGAGFASASSVRGTRCSKSESHSPVRAQAEKAACSLVLDSLAANSKQGILGYSVRPSACDERYMGGASTGGTVPDRRIALSRGGGGVAALQTAVGVSFHASHSPGARIPRRRRRTTGRSQLRPCAA